MIRLLRPPYQKNRKRTKKKTRGSGNKPVPAAIKIPDGRRTGTVIRNDGRCSTNPSANTKTNQTTQTGTEDHTNATRTTPATRSNNAMRENEENENEENNAVPATLCIGGILLRIIGYLPSKQRQRSCTLVSKGWRRAVLAEPTAGGNNNNNDQFLPLVLRIEDPVSMGKGTHHRKTRAKKNVRNDKYGYRDYGICETKPAKHGCSKNKNRSKHFDDDDDDDDDDDEVFWFPLHAIGRLPRGVAARTTKLILVLKFVRDYAGEYDLNEFAFCDGKPLAFLGRFRNLQDLTVLSEYAADQFASILCRCPGQEPPRLLSLKRIQYEETNASDWRSSSLGAFVELAPNLEVLELRENIVRNWDTGGELFPTEPISDLLPLAGTLRQLVLFNRHNLHGDFGAFLERMPLLESWDVFCWGVEMGRWPTVCGLETFRTFRDNAYRGVDLNEPQEFVCFLKDETEFILTMQEAVAEWFLRLDDPNLHPWRHRVPTMVGYLDALVREYFGPEGGFYEDRPVRPYPLPTLVRLLGVDPHATTGSSSSTSSSSSSSSSSSLTARPKGGGSGYASYCSLSKTQTRLLNFHRVVKPCMEIYHEEFLYYSDFYRYNLFRRIKQRIQLGRLVRCISVPSDRYRQTPATWFEKAFSEHNGFHLLA